MRVAVRAKANRMEGNYVFEPGQDKKSGCISTGCATFLYLTCWSRCQDKKIEASTCPFVPLETNGLCLLLLFYMFMLLKVKWRESVWIQPRPVKYWHGALWRTISSYQSMWKWFIVLAAKCKPNWKTCCNIWICHNTFTGIHYSSCLRLFPHSPPLLMSAENYTLFIKNSVTFPLFGVTRWWKLFKKMKKWSSMIKSFFLKLLHLVLGENWQILSLYQSANRENYFLIPWVNNLGHISLLLLVSCPCDLAILAKS